MIADPALVEIDQGAWAGRLRREVYTPAVLEAIGADNYRFHAPGGESQENVEQRVYRWFESTVVNRYPATVAVGVFFHGFALKCLLRKILEFTPKMTYKVEIDNTSITRLRYDDNGWHVLGINDASHLQ
jgi:broad specificity phosphatase PhoE